MLLWIVLALVAAAVVSAAAHWRNSVRRKRRGFARQHRKNEVQQAWRAMLRDRGGIVVRLRVTPRSPRPAARLSYR